MNVGWLGFLQSMCEDVLEMQEAIDAAHEDLVLQPPPAPDTDAPAAASRSRRMSFKLVPKASLVPPAALGE